MLNREVIGPIVRALVPVRLDCRVRVTPEVVFSTVPVPATTVVLLSMMMPPLSARLLVLALAMLDVLVVLAAAPVNTSGAEMTLLAPATPPLVITGLALA